MNASTLCFRSAVCLATIGMCAGIAMAISQNHSVMPAHAHLNLLGWVSMFLMGSFYHFHPALDQSRLAMAQVLSWLAGTVVLTIGVAMIYLGWPTFEPAAAIGSVILLASMLLFAGLVFRPVRQTNLAPQASPAE